MSTTRGSDTGFNRGRARVPEPAEAETDRLRRARLGERGTSPLLAFLGRLRLPSQIFGRLRRPGRKSLSWTALVLAMGVLTVSVLSAQGFPAADLNLNDGGVWVTFRDQNMFGRFNKPIEQLDALLYPGGSQPDIDLLQDASTVFLVDHTAGVLRRVDAADRDFAHEDVALPGSAQVAMGGGVVAVLNGDSGKLWVRSADTLQGLDVSQDPPTAEVGQDSSLAVGLDGTVYAVSSAADTLVSLPKGGEKESRKLGIDVIDATVTAVGGTPAVLGKGGKLVLPDDQVTVDASARLQQPGPADSGLLIATEQQLIRVGLSNGDSETLASGGTGSQAAPVLRDGCVHSAWGGSAPSYVRVCAGAAAEPPVSLEGLSSAADLVFRVNRDVVLLNDAAQGHLYLFERGGEDLGNWQELIEQIKPDPSKNPTKPNPDPDRNSKPEANNDVFGARPGQAALLHVLDNDTDPDGDVLTIASTAAFKPAGAGRLSIVANGQALQFLPSPGDGQTKVTFQYTISDGNGNTATAGVTVNVKPDGNTPPHLRDGANRSLEVERGGTLTFDVLRDWRDDDGDALLLAEASTAQPDRVRFTPGGELTFTAAPNSPTGPKAVALKVSDGTVLQDGTVTVTVVDRDRPPVAENDLVTAVVGEEIVIRPLDNDRDPNTTVPASQQQLRLSWVGDTKPGSSRTPDFIAGTIKFKAGAVDTYYLQYRVTDGKSEATGRIRIDVTKRTSAHAPVAVADQVALRGGTPAIVDVLANDVDLDGDVLAVRSVEAPENSGLSVAVIEHRWLRVTAIRSDVGSPRYTVRYVVSDGEKEDTGVVTVTRLDSAENQPPVAVQDSAKVRAGDVVDIDVLANDSDPDGTSLTLDPRVVDDNAANKHGEWLVTGGHVRFHANEVPGTATGSYSVRDQNGQTAVGQITVTVIDPKAPNQIPDPKPLQARAFAGGTVRIQVPLTGVDPDGDSVLLLGPVKAPQLGRIVNQGIDYFDYEAYPGSGGTDVFTYRVQDGFGGLGTGLVQVGVVPFPDHDSAPVAVDDEYVVAPGATVRVPVLTNDSDVDGDPLTLEDLGPLNPSLPAGAKVSGSAVTLKAGSADRDVVTVRYGVSDGRGQRATATVRLISRDGANLAPIARDDVAGPVAAGAKSIDVDVLANDDDLDGSAGDLSFEPINVGNGPQATVAGGKLRVPLTDSARQVAYRLKDRHDGVAVAFVRVPGTGPQPPRLKADVGELVVTSGAELSVNLPDLVEDPQGLPVRLTRTEAISTSPAESLRLVAGASTPTSFKLAAAPEFSGRASVVFEVENGKASASLSVRVKVVPSGKQPPVFACPPAEPTAGAPAVTVELVRCVRSSATEGLRFVLDGDAPASLTAELTGSRLKLSAAPDAQVGDRGKLRLTITDGAGATADGELGIVVRPSGLAVANTDFYDTKVGEETRINVIANDVNPFPNSPLKLVSVESADVPGVRIDAAKGEIVFTPPRHGKETFRYTVQDATGKADRRVNGDVVVTVIDKPLAPGQPVARSEGDKFVVLVWSEPDNQGSAISKYVVTGTDGYSQECDSTVCRLDGLSNGKVYRFKVHARNDAGDGPDSPESADTHPDAKPDQPQAPTTTFGDSKIALNWSAPNGNGGSPIRSYEVEISPGGTVTPITGTSYTWPNLTNGAAYTFRIRARNDNLFSEWSASSAPEIPAKQPDAPQAPSAAGVADGIGQQIVVNWIEPPVNGAAISEYQLTVVRAGVVERTINVPGDQTQATVNVDNGVDYRFSVVAVNKAGPSQASPQSAATVAHGKPFPVLTYSYSDNSGGTGYDQRVAYTLTPPGDNGLAINHYEFDVDGNGSADTSDTGASGFVTGLGNGTTYQIRVRACNDMCGDWSGPGNSVQPYGPVPQPGVSANKNGATSVNLSWSSGGTNGRPLNRIEFRVNGGGWQNLGLSGTVSCGSGYSQTCTIDARAFDSAGQVSGTASASATTDAPPGTVTVTKGASAQGQPGCSSSYCAFIRVTLANFAPNTSYACDINSAHGDLYDVTVTTNGSGSGTAQALSYYGYNTGWVSATCGGITGTRNPWG